MNNATLLKVLSDVYPEYEWLPWKFTHVSPNYWQDVKNQKQFMDWAGKELKIKNIEDWYNVTRAV